MSSATRGKTHGCQRRSSAAELLLHLAVPRHSIEPNVESRMEVAVLANNPLITTLDR